MLGFEKYACQLEIEGDLAASTWFEVGRKSLILTWFCDERFLEKRCRTVSGLVTVCGRPLCGMVRIVPGNLSPAEPEAQACFSVVDVAPVAVGIQEDVLRRSEG